MNTPPPDTICQRAQTVPTALGPIEVRRMRWKPAVGFVNKLAGHFGTIQELLAAAPGGGEGASALSFVSLLLPKLPALVLSVDELADHLLVHSAGLTRVQIDDELDTGDALELIRTALALNLGDDLKKSCAGIAAALRGLGGAPISASSSAASTTP